MNKIGTSLAGHAPGIASVEESSNLPEGTHNQNSQEVTAEPAVRSNPQTMLGELGLDGQMRQMEIERMFAPVGVANSPALYSAQTTVQAQSPAAPTAKMLLDALPAKLDAAKVPPRLRDELMALGKNRPAIDVRILVKHTETALKSGDPASAIKSLILQTRTDDFFESFNATYKVNGMEVQATPHFRMTNGFSGPRGRTTSVNVQDDLNRLISSKDKANYNQGMKSAIHGVAYGRATPAQVKMVTEALIRSGQFEVAQKKYPGLSESEQIRMMQWDNGVGIDCAGYVQQAFMAAHGGSRADFGFKGFENEDLMSLKRNKNFVQVKPENVRPGDLIALDRPPNDSVGHTVLVRDRHPITAEEKSKYNDPEGFIKPGDKVHVYEVDASFGGGYTGDRGGVVRKVWMYNEKTSQWAEIVSDPVDGDKIQISQASGPYNHPMNGIYRPKTK